jgi:hypothetical protein
MENIIALLIENCVRFVPSQNLGIICVKKSKCHRACPCAEYGKNAVQFALNTYKRKRTQDIKDTLAEFCDSIRDYELESGHAISENKDDRETIEFVSLFLEKWEKEQNK